MKAEFGQSLQKISANFASAASSSIDSGIISNDFMRLFHVTAYVMKFIHKLKAVKVGLEFKE